MSRWFTGKVAYLTTWISLKLGCVAVTMLPGWCLYRLSDQLANVGFYLARGFRRRSMTNIQAALGARMDQAAIAETARRSLRNFVRACVEVAIVINASNDDVRNSIPLMGREHLDAALAKGKGVIVLSAHLGNFFLVGCRLAVEGYSIFVLVNQPRDARFARLLDEYRLQARQKTIHARPRPQALQQLNQVLRRNEITMMIADEYRDRRGVPVPLFGKTVLARRGPATLAMRTGAAVVPVYMIRQPDDRLMLFIEPELELERSVRDKTAIQENTLRLTQWLERTVSCHPEQWNWMNIRAWERVPSGPRSHHDKPQRFA